MYIVILMFEQGVGRITFGQVYRSREPLTQKYPSPTEDGQFPSTNLVIQWPDGTQQYCEKHGRSCVHVKRTVPWSLVRMGLFAGDEDQLLPAWNAVIATIVHPFRSSGNRCRRRRGRRTDRDKLDAVNVWDHVSLVGKNVGTRIWPLGLCGDPERL